MSDKSTMVIQHPWPCHISYNMFWMLSLSQEKEISFLKYALLSGGLSLLFQHCHMGIYLQFQAKL